MVTQADAESQGFVAPSGIFCCVGRFSNSKMKTAVFTAVFMLRVFQSLFGYGLCACDLPARSSSGSDQRTIHASSDLPNPSPQHFSSARSGTADIWTGSSRSRPSPARKPAPPALEFLSFYEEKECNLQQNYSKIIIFTIILPLFPQGSGLRLPSLI